MKIVLMLAWLAFCYATAPKFIKLNGNNNPNDNKIIKTVIMFVAPVVLLTILKIIGFVISLTLMLIVILVFAAMAAIAIGVIRKAL